MERRQTFTIIGAIVLLSISGIGLAATGGLGSAEASLSEEDARQIAENETDGTAQTVEFEREEGPVYEVTVETDEGPKEVDVDGDTGEVLEIETEDDESEDDADDDSGEAEDDD